MSHRQHVYLTFNDDRTVDHVYATRHGALDRAVAEMHRARGGAGWPIADWDREQLERLAAGMIDEQEVLP